jgi:hypothetical protein
MKHPTEDLTYCAEVLAYSAKINLSDGLSQVLEVSQKVPTLKTQIPQDITGELLNLKLDIAAIQRRIIKVSNRFLELI